MMSRIRFNGIFNDFKTMNILITNDDGWGFEGIVELEAIAGQHGNVWTVAPSKPMSGISHQMTFERPMEFIQKAPQSYSLDGTPADCVRIAMTQLDVDFDWVFSGINKGANLGSDIFVSGTVAAAREATLFGVPAIAFSQHLRKFKAPVDWSQPRRMAKSILPELLTHSQPTAGWINVNFPDLGSDITELTPTHTKPDRLPLPTDYRETANGELLFCGTYNKRERTPGLDVDVCLSGGISITYHSHSSD